MANVLLISVLWRKSGDNMKQIHTTPGSKHKTGIFFWGCVVMACFSILIGLHIALAKWRLYGENDEIQWVYSITPIAVTKLSKGEVIVVNLVSFVGAILLIYFAFKAAQQLYSE